MRFLLIALLGFGWGVGREAAGCGGGMGSCGHEANILIQQPLGFITEAWRKQAAIGGTKTPLCSEVGVSAEEACYLEDGVDWKTIKERVPAPSKTITQPENANRQQQQPPQYNAVKPPGWKMSLCSEVGVSAEEACSLEDGADWRTIKERVWTPTEQVNKDNIEQQDPTRRQTTQVRGIKWKMPLCSEFGSSEEGACSLEDGADPRSIKNRTPQQQADLDKGSALNQKDNVWHLGPSSQRRGLSSCHVIGVSSRVSCSAAQSPSETSNVAHNAESVQNNREQSLESSLGKRQMPLCSEVGVSAHCLLEDGTNWKTIEDASHRAKVENLDKHYDQHDDEEYENPGVRINWHDVIRWALEELANHALFDNAGDIWGAAHAEVLTRQILHHPDVVDLIHEVSRLPLHRRRQLITPLPHGPPLMVQNPANPGGGLVPGPPATPSFAMTNVITLAINAHFGVAPVPAIMTANDIVAIAQRVVGDPMVHDIMANAQHYMTWYRQVHGANAHVKAGITRPPERIRLSSYHRQHPLSRNVGELYRTFIYTPIWAPGPAGGFVVARAPHVFANGVVVNVQAHVLIARHVETFLQDFNFMNPLVGQPVTHLANRLPQHLMFRDPNDHGPGAFPHDPLLDEIGYIQVWH